MKVLFFDVDGVLNCSKTFKYNTEKYKETGVRLPKLDELKIQRLKKIVDETDCKLVISSTWRKDIKMINGKAHALERDAAELIEYLAKYDLYIFDRTGSNSDNNRGKEIKEWIVNSQYDIESFCIVDDDTFDIKSEFSLDKIVKTYFHGDGLDDNTVKEIIYILNNIPYKKYTDGTVYRKEVKKND